MQFINKFIELKNRKSLIFIYIYILFCETKNDEEDVDQLLQNKYYSNYFSSHQLKDSSHH
jgi:hypothetical protein